MLFLPAELSVNKITSYNTPFVRIEHVLSGTQVRDQREKRANSIKFIHFSQ